MEVFFIFFGKLVIKCQIMFIYPHGHLLNMCSRGGSIDSRFRSQSTLLDGTRIHQKIQKNYQATDQKEVYAHKHTICPLEFSLDLACAVDTVICDYTYIFDPRVSLKRLIEEQKKSTVLLVDEGTILLTVVGRCFQLL